MNLMIKIERYFAWRYFTRHAHKASVPPYGTLRISTWIPDPKNNNIEKIGSSMARTSLDPGADLRTIESVLELKTAILKRGVVIDPYTLYEHVIGRKYFRFGPDKSVAEVETTERVGQVSKTTVTRFK